MQGFRGIGDEELQAHKTAMTSAYADGGVCYGNLLTRLARVYPELVRQRAILRFVGMVMLCFLIPLLFAPLGNGTMMGNYFASTVGVVVTVASIILAVVGVLYLMACSSWKRVHTLTCKREVTTQPIGDAQAQIRTRLCH